MEWSDGQHQSGGRRAVHCWQNQSFFTYISYVVVTLYLILLFWFACVDYGLCLWVLLMLYLAFFKFILISFL